MIKTKSEIETVTAKIGRPVLKKNGRLLASAFDPAREARQWAEKAIARVAEDEMMIVLGMGAGYHVAELTARRPRGPVIVIDNDASLVERALEIHPQFAPEFVNDDGDRRSIDVVVESDWLRLVENSKVRNAVQGVYHVFSHGPSFQIEPEYFGAVDRLLRGRDKLSFLLLLKTRPELFAALDPESLKKIGDEAIGIKTVREIFAVRATSSRERRLWRLLEELIV